MFDLLKKCVDVYGATGREGKAADLMESLVKGCETSRDVMGNLICVKKGTGRGRRILLSAHMDHIGYIVAAVEKEGYLRVAPVGGISLSQSRTRHVSFENGVQGVLCEQPLREGESDAMKHFYIDIGAADKEEALKMVKLGDVAVYANDCFRLGEHRAAAPAMDDRSACAVLVSLLNALPEGLDDTVIGVFSTQEEVGCRGAKTAAYALEPDIAIALDVTGNGDTPETKFPSVSLGEGACVKIMDRGSISNPALVEELLAAGEAAGVKTQREILPYGATDAMSMQLTRGGVKVCTVSIPCRNVHSACEVVDLRDMEAAVKLLLAFVK